MRALWMAPLALTTLYGAYLGFREGRSVTDPSETDAIARFARYYVAEVDGARSRDCVAVPGTGRVWLIVECTPEPFDAERQRRYVVGHDGRVLPLPDGT